MAFLKRLSSNGPAPLPSPALSAAGNTSGYFPAVPISPNPTGQAPVHAGAPTAPTTVIDRPTLHASLKALEQLLHALDDHRICEARLAAADKRLAIATREFAVTLEVGQPKGEAVAAGALKAAAKLYEAVAEVESKAFKKIAKDEREFDEASDALDAKVRKADEAFAKRARQLGPSSPNLQSVSKRAQAGLLSVDLEEASALQQKRIATLASLGAEIDAHRGAHGAKMAARRDTVALAAAKSVALLSQAAWQRVFESTKRAGNEIGCVGAWHALLDVPGIVVPDDLPDAIVPPPPSSRPLPAPRTIPTRRQSAAEVDPQVVGSPPGNSTDHSASSSELKTPIDSSPPFIPSSVKSIAIPPRGPRPQLGRAETAPVTISPTTSRRNSYSEPPPQLSPAQRNRERDRSRPTSPTRTQSDQRVLVDIANLSRNEDVDAAVIVLSRNDDTGELERHRLSPILPQGFLYGDESSPERERDRSRAQTTSSSPVKETRMAARSPSIIPDHPQQRSYSGTDSGDPDESRGSFVAQMKSRYGSTDQETVRPSANGHGHSRTGATSPERPPPRVFRRVSDLARRFDPTELSQPPPPPPSAARPQGRAVSHSGEIVHSDICACSSCTAKHYGRSPPPSSTTLDRQQRRTSMPVSQRR